MRERYDEVLEGYTILEDELKEESEFDRLMESSYQKWLDTLERLVQIRNRIFMSLIKLVTWSIRMMLWIRPLRQKI